MTVVPYANLPLADRGRAWDASGARRRMLEAAGGDLESASAQASYRRGFVWYDAEASENVGSYKLPLADVIDGSLRAVPRGFFAAANVLVGGRGGAAIPASDVGAARAHVARYYAKARSEFDDDTITVPWEGNSLRENRTVRVFELRDAKVEATDDDELRFEGYAAVFNEWSEDLGGFREKIEPGAFADVLSDDVRLLINHEESRLLARTANGTLELEEDTDGLTMRADVAPTSYARDLKILLERGDMSQMSFGFRVAEDSWKETDDAVERTIQKVERLFDVSVVTFPAYPQTEAVARAIAGNFAWARRPVAPARRSRAFHQRRLALLDRP